MLFDILFLHFCVGVVTMVSSYEAFLEGIKPSTYVNLDILSRPELIPELQKYPSWNDGENFWMFFQTEEQKENFLSQHDCLHEDDPERERIVGLELGFPPKAVNFYTHYYKWQQHDREKAKEWFFANKASMYYHGLRFTSHVDDLEDNVRWLWSKYQIDEPVEVSIDDHDLYIVYKNNDDLHRVSAEAKLYKSSPVLI